MASFTINQSNVDYDDDLSEAEDNQQDFLMYKDRPEWSDLKPVLQNDGLHKVVSIRYSPQYEDTYNYFRGVLAVEEISERALRLTEDCIRFNASNYTVWHYRRILLDKLNKNLIEEMNYINKIILKNPKNYQVWEHQKFLLRRIKEKISRNEIEQLSFDDVAKSFKKFINDVLRINDAKNYHAWQQRQWFIRDWDQFDGELKYVDEIILENDIRNNSAWNHRYFVIQNTTGFNDEVIHQECQYAIKMIRLATHNESSWNYLLGVFKQSSKDIDSFKWLMDICQELYQDVDEGAKSTRSPYLIYFMFKYLCLQMDKMIENNIKHNQYEKFQEIYSKAKSYCEELAQSADTIRQHYWNYQSEQIQKIYGQ